MIDVDRVILDDLIDWERDATEDILMKINDYIYEGGDVNAINDFGGTALHSAAFSGRTEAVEFLIANNAIVDKPDGNGCRPLHYASCRGHFDTVKSLLNKGADLNAKNDANETPWDNALYNGYKKTAELLKPKENPVAPVKVDGHILPPNLSNPSNINFDKQYG